MSALASGSSHEGEPSAEPTGEGIAIRFSLSRADFDLEVDLQLPGRGITVLHGPSGSGKTSVLRCVAGLERPLNGHVRIGGQVWQDDRRGIFLPTWRRALGYVFQEASLFDHLDVRANLHFGLRRDTDPLARRSLAEAIELLGIGHLLDRAPQALSGGERQRVAIARALAARPRVLLLDEPLAAIDHSRRQEILPWLERLRDELQMPMIHVTHSADEVARLATHLVVLEAGRVRASGAVAGVLSSLDTPVVVGEDTAALLEGQLCERDTGWNLARVVFAGGSLWVADSGLDLGRRVRLRVLARDVSITTAEPVHTSIQNHVRGLIDSMVGDVHPSQVLVRILCGESVILARVTRRAIASLGLARGSAVWAQVKSVALVQ